VTANCLHPGFVATHFAQSDGGSAVRLLVKLIGSFGASPQEGAKTSIYLASSPEVEGVTGTYFVKSIPKRSAAISYYEALTGDDYVDECQHGVEHLIVRSKTIHTRSASCAGQVRVEAQPALPLHKERFHQSLHDAVIARSPR
jgi:hypothetical protein